MRLQITNYRSIAVADLELSDKITLIAGPNRAGKTSLCEAIGAALSGQPKILGLTAKDTEQLVTDQAADASVLLSSNGASRGVTWPACKVSETGQAPVSSPTAVGVLKLTAMPLRDRAAYISKTLKATPTLQQVRAAGGDDDLWQRLMTIGWDNAYTDARERLAKMKGAWEHITGQRWGSDKMLAFKFSLPLQSPQELGIIVEQCRAKLARKVVDAERRELLTRIAATLPAAEEAQVRAVEARKAHPPDPEQTAACPHCQKPVLVVSRTDLRAPGKAISAAELKALREARATLDGKLAHAQDAVRQAQGAAKELAAMPADSGPAVDRDAVQVQLTLNEAGIAAHRAAKEAETVTAQIQGQMKVVDLLAPEGLRQGCLTAALADLNGRLAGACQVAKWPVVEVATSLRVWVGKRLYEFASGSEQFRADVVLQLVLGFQYEDSNAVVIDAADILDNPARMGLLQLASQCHNRPVVIAMTASKRDAVPDLASKGLGATLWVEGGVVG
jgi:hypothetical protein